MAVARKQVIIDTDPGIDDAIAIFMALADAGVEVLGLTPVAGNAPLENTTLNALRILDLADRPDIPVFPGAARPLVHLAPRYAADTHGELGLGEAELIAPSRSASSEHAVDFIVRTVRSAGAPVTIVAIAPLTNIALLVATHPEVIPSIEEVVVMGGGSEGNVTPAAEFNIWFDPEGAQRVLQSGLNLTFVGLDVTHQANLTPDDLPRIAAMGKVGSAVARMLETYDAAHQQFYGSRLLPMHDALAIAHVIDPSLMQFEHLRVDVDCGFSIGRGATVLDRWGITGAPKNVRYARTVDSERFHLLLMDRLDRFSGVD